MKWLFILAVSLVACTARHDAGTLVNGFQLLAMNPAELYVAKPDGELILGPTIEKVGISNDAVVVYCGSQERSVNGFANTIGYSIVYTRTGEVAKHLTEQEMRETLLARNTPVPSLDPPQKFLH